MAARCLVRALMGACSITAFAAAATPAAAQEGADDIVTVTAQRRAQNLQDVPITIQVVSGENIETLAADNIGDIDIFVPGLSVSSGSPTQPRYAIRGVSTSDFGVGTDPAVGVYVDGVYAARSGASLLAFNDIERIEIIKGPQGTLFGRNSAAGAVSVTTKKPSDEFEARAAFRYGRFDKRRAEALLNLPVADDLAFRINGVWNKRDGLYTDAATGEDLGREDNWAIRAAARLDLGPDTQAILAYVHDELDQDARPAIGIVPIPAAPGQPPVPTDSSTYIDPFAAPVLNDVVGNSERRNLDELTLTLTHNFGALELSSISSYRHFQTNNREDEDGTNRIDLYFDTNNVEENKSFYQELRLTGETGPVNWIVGASYYDEQADQRSDTFTFTDTVNTTLGNIGLGTPFTDLEYGLLIPFDVPATMLGHGWSEDMINSGDYQAYAVFADAIWAVTDRLSVTAGVRYTRDEKSFTWLNGPRVAPELDATLQALDDMGLLALAGATPEDFQFDFIFDLSSLAGVPCDNGVTVAEGVKCRLDDSWSDISPRFVVDYKLTDDVLVFASFAEGYKAGGFNSVEVASRFDNEDVRNYEAGVKSAFPDLGLRFNGSFFYYTYDDKQAIRLVADAGGSGVPQYLVETSDEKAYGIDLQADWEPVENLNFFANAQYIDVTYKERITRDDVDLKGQPTGEPLWSFSVGGSYLHDFEQAGEVEFLVAHAYEGERRCNDESLAQGDCLTQGIIKVGEARNRTDLRLYWRDKNDRIQIGAFVNNAFDNRYVNGINNISAATLGTPFASISEPRIWGFDIQLTY